MAAKVKINIEMDIAWDGYEVDDLLWSLRELANRVSDNYKDKNRLDDMAIRDKNGSSVGKMDCTIVKD